MVRPAHVVCLLLAGIPLVRYSEVAIRERVAHGKDSSEAWTLRSDLLARSQIFVSDGTGIGALDLSKSPRDPRPFDPSTPLACKYEPDDITGTTTKFDCRLEDGGEVKVKYGSLPEPRAEVAATRLLAALGFAADHVTFVEKLTCKGCNYSPYRAGRLAEFYYLKPMVDWLSKPMTQEFRRVSIERKFEARSINLVSMNGWSFAELDKVDAAKGGASPAEVDALRLIAVFLAHWDNKPPNQRLVCLDSPDGKSSDPNCARPLLMLQDVGATFGPTKMRLEKWKDAPIWSDATSCRVDFTTMPYHGDGFPAVTISEAGRALLASRMRQLSERQVSDLFVNAHFPDAADWVPVFMQRVAQIADRHCPQSEK